MTVRDTNDPGTQEFDFGDPELNDPDYESKVGGDADAPEDTTTDTSTQVATPADSVTPSAAPVTGSTPASAVGAGGAEGQQPAKTGPVKADDKGNLVDSKGNIIATAGAERRYYERVQQLQKHSRTLERELEAARSVNASATALNGAPAKLGLDMRETELGLQIMSSFKKDPVSTARWALQETMRMGYNLAQIVGADANGQPAGGSMELAAVKDMIQAAVAPLVGDRQTQQRTAEVQQAAQRDYDAFIANHDNASVHEDIIATMLGNDESLKPEVAYWQLVAYAARNQLDFAQPLRPQMQARQSGQAQPQQHQNGNAQPPSAQQLAPMPNGSPMTADVQQSDGMAAPDDSWDNIVRESMRNAGFGRH